MSTNTVSIGKEAAIAIAETGWWKGESARKIVEFQLFTQELCMDFGDFHAAAEAALERPVFTHEFSVNLEGLQREFLIGKSEAPTFEDIVNMIPEEKRILVRIPQHEEKD